MDQLEIRILRMLADGTRTDISAGTLTLREGWQSPDRAGEVLARMESEGLLRAYGTSERFRYYKITKAGRKALEGEHERKEILRQVRQDPQHMGGGQADGHVVQVHGRLRMGEEEGV